VYIHKPVLLNEAMAALNDQKEELVFIDATLGEGGHAVAFLSRNPRLIPVSYTHLTLPTSDLV